MKFLNKEEKFEVISYTHTQQKDFRHEIIFLNV